MKNEEHHPKNHSSEASDSKFQYTPLVIVFAYCLLLSCVPASSGMHSFMGYFFIFLSMFKFFDIKSFVAAFSSYDLIAKKYDVYGYIYPVIELALGISYLTNFLPVFINIFTCIVMLTSGVGVLKSVLSHQKIKCACLGTVLNVPLSTVSILENFGMAAMALGSLIFSASY